MRKGIKIDNHVWLGINVVLLKNTHIMSNSVIGAASTLGGVIVPPNTIYPERKRKKKEVTWERERKASIVPTEKPFALKKKIEIQQDSNKEIIFVIENKIDNCFNKIQGWAFLKNKLASESQIYIRVGFKKNKALVIPLRSIPREDVADFFGDKRYLLCGFCQYMPAAIIQKWNIIEWLEILICNQGIWKSKIFYP